jgi:hypothetical protein
MVAAVWLANAPGFRSIVCLKRVGHHGGYQGSIRQIQSSRILRLDLVCVLVSILRSEQGDSVDTRDGIDRIGKPASALE